MRDLPSSVVPVPFLLLALSSATFAQVGVDGGPRSVAHSAFALQNGAGTHDLWLVPEGSRVTAGRRALPDVAFLPLQLVGYARHDSLRLDLPTPDARLVPHVALPGGGALYRVDHAGSCGLLVLDADGTPHLRFSVTGAGGIEDRVHVDADGRHAVVATAGGDVWLVDLAGEVAPHCATAALPALAVEPGSVRASHAGLFFVADGALYRATAGGQAHVVPLDLLDGEQPLADLAPAADGAHVAVVTHLEDHARRLHVVPLHGAPVLVTPAPLDMLPVGTDQDLGPWVALSPDGLRVVWVAEEATGKELYSRELEYPAERHLTSLPDFPDYVDNIGVLSFTRVDMLSMVAGDVKLAGNLEDEMIGAAEVYAVCFEPQEELKWMNLTLTNGQDSPPFSAPATMVVGGVRLDPRGDRALIVAETEETSGLISCFRTDGVPDSSGQNFMVILTQLEDHPHFARVGASVLLVTRSEIEDSGALDLHLLPPFDVEAPPGLVHLAAFPAGTVFDRIAGNDVRGAFATTAAGLERLHAIDLATGVLWEAAPAETAGTYAATLTVAEDGALRTSRPAGGGTVHLEISAPGQARALGLPQTAGFPVPIR